MPLSTSGSPVHPDRPHKGVGKLSEFLFAKVRVAVWRRGHLIAAVLLSAFVLSSTVTFAKWYLAQDDRLGVLHFPISCGWQSQREFIGATSLLHLFQFAEAGYVYSDLVKRDSDCAMGYWGIAMSRLQNPLYLLPSEDDVDIARRALTAAEGAHHTSARERAYVAAARKLFPESKIPAWRERLIAYSQAMEIVATNYPDDREATVFFALALNFVAQYGGSISRERTRAAELLLQVFSEQPDHPGISHYLTYCLGHEKYQPRPFERPIMINPGQRIVLAAFAFLALLGLGAFVTFTANLRTTEQIGFGGPFMLTATDGRVVSDRTFRGEYMLVYFGYTHCPDVCPTTLMTLSQVLEKLGPSADNIRSIFISIDPERDTPAAVGRFLESFDQRIIGLTGSSAEIAAVAKQYRVFYKKLPIENSDDYSMEHSSYIYLMDRANRYLTLFSPDQSSDQITARLREWLTVPRPDDRAAERVAPNTLATSGGK